MRPGSSLSQPVLRVVRRAADSDDADVSPSDIEVEDIPPEAPREAATDDDVPSDIEGDAFGPSQATSSTAGDHHKEAALLALCAATGRGACATEYERADVDARCRELEAAGDPGASLEGRWRLAYCSVPGLYRSSPFFWAFAKLLSTAPDAPFQLRGARDSSYAENVLTLTDGLPLYEVGAATQTITPTQLVSEVELTFKLFDGVLPRARSVMTTTARVTPSPRGLLLTLEKTQVKDSTIENALPGLSFVGDLAFPTESAFPRVADALGTLFRGGGGSTGAPASGPEQVELITAYTSDSLRITRADPVASASSGGPLTFVHVRDDDPFFF